jgi:hypothetical protein
MQGPRIDWKTFDGGWICVPGGKQAHHIDVVQGITARTACKRLMVLQRADEFGAIAWTAGTLRLCPSCRKAVDRGKLGGFGR